MRFARPLLVVSAVLLTACVPPAKAPQQGSETAAMKNDGGSSAPMASSVSSSAPMQQASTSAAAMQEARQNDAPPKATTVYATFSDDVLMNGETKVLFFHAAWCPKCRTADTALTSWFASQAMPHSVYKIDYDTESELKSRYGIVQQHTFVRVDGKGNVLSRLEWPDNNGLLAWLNS